MKPDSHPKIKNLNAARPGLGTSKNAPHRRRSRIVFRIGSAVLVPLAVLSVRPQQNPSPMSDTTRPHSRIERNDPPGQRIELSTLKGARLFIGPKVRKDRGTPLIIHFHGAPWLVEYQIAKYYPKAALITVQIGSGSSAYGKPFGDTGLFGALIDEAAKTLGSKAEWSSITLTGFSAGYGGIRAILRQEENYRRVDRVLLLDGIHASYLPEGKVIADGGTINEGDIAPFIAFARDAAAGRKHFVISHSEIFPGTFASTTECVDYVIRSIGLKRVPKLRDGPMGMQQLSTVDQSGFHVRGYAGNTAPDHVDHLHAMNYWLKMVKVD
ncbi:MAG: hypothetical protein ABI539_11405 [Acidobacteriota bacterium]